MTDPATSAPRRRWLLPALGVSLACNLLVVGVVVGALWGRGPEGAGGPRVSLGGTLWLEALDPADRAALRAAWRAEGPDSSRLRGERRAQAAGVAALLRAEPFDPAALSRALAQEAAVRAEREALTRRLLVAQLAAMTPQARAAYADRLEAVAERRRPGRAGPPGRRAE